MEKSVADSRTPEEIARDYANELVEIEVLCDLEYDGNPGVEGSETYVAGDKLMVTRLVKAAFVGAGICVA